MARQILDTRQLMSGKDGFMYINVNGQDYFMAQVDTFQVQASISNSDYQPVGSVLSYAVPTGVSFTLTFSEAVISDQYVAKPIIDAIAEGHFPMFDFAGLCERPDGQTQRMTFKNCVPDGSVDLMNLTPGDILKRSFSFRINSVPSYLNSLV